MTTQPIIESGMTFGPFPGGRCFYIEKSNTIHPFLDGNGRIGRLLINLYLVSHGLLRKPPLYLSAHLEKHRTAYFDALARVREANDPGHWRRFFFQAVIETAESGKNTFQRIMALRDETEKQVVALGRRAENALRLIRNLYGKPAVTIQGVMQELDLHYNPANSLIASLCDLGLLKEITGYRRNRIFVFDSYLQIFQADSEI